MIRMGTCLFPKTIKQQQYQLASQQSRLATLKKTGREIVIGDDFFEKFLIFPELRKYSHWGEMGSGVSALDQDPLAPTLDEFIKH